MRIIRWACLCCFALLAWAAPADAEEILTNQNVIDMVKANLQEDLIRRKITSCDNDFDVTAAAMVELRKAGVPDPVIESMLNEAEKQKTRRANRVNLQLQLLTSDLPESRYTAYLRLVEMGGTARLRMMEILTSNADNTLRAAVARALGQMSAAEAIERLRLLMGDPNAEVRAAAADALYRLDEKASAELSLKTLGEWKPYISAAPIDAHVRLLGLAREARAAGPIRQVLQESEPATARAEAALALGRIPAPEAREPLERVLLNDGAAAVRAAAAEALGLLHAPESFQPLLDAAKSDKANRAVLYHALGQYPAAQVIPFLIRQFDLKLSAEEETAALGVLRRLTKRDFGTDQAKWFAWWEENERALQEGTKTEK